MSKKATTKKAEPKAEETKKRTRKPADTASLTRRLNTTIYALVDMVRKEDDLDADDALDVVRELAVDRCAQYAKEIEARDKIAELQEQYGDLIDFKIKK